MKKKVILTTYSNLLYTQNMSEPEERPYAGIKEEQKQEELHEGEETTVEEKREGVKAIRSTEEEVVKEKAPEQEEEKATVSTEKLRLPK
jgi:Rieske Fe-S protein